MNLKLAQRVLEGLARRGIKDIVLCSGARNSPFVALLDKSTGFNLYSFFEERSAAFFALGRIKKHGDPVAVFTTSGTAAAELFPAVIESHYSGVPLVLVTADRPRKLRGTGAPQCIDQVNLFGSHTEQFFDLAENDLLNLDSWTGRGPLHLNICFNEPLINGNEPSLAFSPKDFIFDLVFCDRTIADHYIQLRNFLGNSRCPVFLVGPLRPGERDVVKKFLLQQQAPVFAEALSGLREDKDLSHVLLKSGDGTLNASNFDALVRIGGVPTVRFWRDIENNPKLIPVISVSGQPFPGLSHGKFIHSDLKKLLTAYEDRHSFALEKIENIFSQDKKSYKNLLGVIDSEPTSEAGLIHRLSFLVEDTASVYLGNSLPIREWDLVANRDRDAQWNMAGNRGVNGIDGQISTFLGFAAEESPSWGIFGDLTTMYDLCSPWAFTQRPTKNTRIVVINNSGGQIFSRMFNSPSFINSHNFSFGEWARMWGLGYEQWTAVPQRFESNEPVVIEIVPDKNATQRFWEKLKQS